MKQPGTYAAWAIFVQVFMMCLSMFGVQADSKGEPGQYVSPEVVFRYGVMLDVGSSGTKLRLYKWPRRDNPEDLPKLEDFYHQKFKPNLTSLAFNDGSIPGYLQPMIDKAKERIPEDVHKDTPIYAIATAGMRILNSTTSRGVFEAVRRHLSNKTVCPFIFYRRQARISSGEEEGVFAWISVNYLRGVFASARQSPSDFAGVLEMGGGSTQITFFPDGPIYAGKFPVQVAGKVYPLYTHSYLVYGQNYIGRRVNMLLMAQTPGANEISNPCMLRGDSMSFRGSNIRGSGQASQCEVLISNLLKRAADEWCYPKPCAIGRTYQPSILDKQFYAIAGFVYTTNDLGMNSSLVPSELKHKATAYCSKTLDEVSDMGIKARFASSLCLMGLYIPKLFTEAYGFPSHSRSITATNRIGDNKIAWTMGAMLYEIERLEFPPPDSDSIHELIESPAQCVTSSAPANNYSNTGLKCLILFLVCLQLHKHAHL